MLIALVERFLHPVERPKRSSVEQTCSSHADGFALRSYAKGKILLC